ncbi:MAG: hypothetical protein ACYC7D_12845 [Nitrososphaerales archaeon]
MVDRNTIVGIDLLVIGGVVSALGYIGVQSIPVAGFGFAVAIMGALILLIVPEPIPQDAFRALLADSITNIEILLEESRLKERAYFLRTDDEKVRAFIPFEKHSPAELLERLNKAPKRFVTNSGDLKGLMLIPPGNEIVRLAKIQKDDDVEESLRNALVGFSDLAASVLAIEEGTEVKIQINNPKISSQSPFFNECLGSPVSCVACCVVASVKGEPVRIVDEKFDKALIRLTLEVAG